MSDSKFQSPVVRTVGPPVARAQCCFLVRMWERENMEDSENIFLIRVVGLSIVRMGLVLECGRAEVLRLNKG